MRNAWRAPIPVTFSLRYVMFKIYSNSCGLARACPPDHTVRNVWRASLLHSVEPVGRPLWLLGQPRSPMAARKLRDDPAERPFGLPKSPRDAFQPLLRCARGYIETISGVFCVDGSAKHMKRPDDIGREAGNGGTQGGKGPHVFWACP